MQNTPEDFTTTSGLLADLTPVRDAVPEHLRAALESIGRRRLSAEDPPPAEPDLEVEVTAEQVRTHELRPIVPAVMEHNLSRKGIWATAPDRHQLEWTYRTEDLVGSLTVEMTLGQLSTFEMELVAWLLGRWQDHGDRKVRFTFRECAREFGVKWGGERPKFLKAALDRIDGTRFVGTVWERSTRRRTRKSFRIVDNVAWVDRADSLDGPSTEPAVVTVTLNDFMIEQLRAGQFKRLDWEALRQRIKSPLGKRLYVFLQGQDGFPAEGGIIYEATIDPVLMETLGCRDRHVRRLRAKLARAGEEIVAADKRYREVGVRPGKGRGAYVLTALRTA
jgi:hypothetical protein